MAGQITAYWNNNLVVSWTDPTPLAAGKVGCRKSTGYVVNWDNFYVWSDGNGSVLSYNDSYPFGLTMPGNRSSSNSYVDGRYRFTGKELDAAETGLFYFGKRYYDPFTCRWPQVDPLADKYPGVSPYNYCMNNPIILFDPDGKWPFWIHNALIRYMFKGDQNKISTYQEASAWTDNKKGHQDAKYSFMHAMRDYQLTPEEGINEINDYLNNPIRKHRKIIRMNLA